MEVVTNLLNLTGDATMKYMNWLAALMAGFMMMGAVGAASDPQALVKETSDKMLAALKQEKDNLKKEPARVYALVDEIVLPHFDFERMSKLVLAQNWKTATPEQQKRFAEEFRALIVRTYATSLIDYADEQVKFLPVQSEAGANRVTVRTEVVKPATGSAIPINYEMYQVGDTWKVFNVEVENVSLVLNYRTSFADQIQRDGLDKLIASLADKTTAANKPE
jgi:phospholipid transport system substrate-binding protein